jgi:hypothetical protein
MVIFQHYLHKGGLKKDKILRMLKKFTIFALTTFTLLVCSQHSLNAENFGLNYEKLNPDSFLYPVKRLTENIWLKTKTGDNKNRLMAFYTDRRFKELIYMFDKGKTGFYAEVVSRYNSFLGSSKTEFGDNNVVKNKQNEYLKILETLRDNYPANSSPWLLIQQTIDVTNSQ